MASPMYRQIAEDLREQIESEQLRPGQQLRTELELREHYGASRNTVRDAIKWLITLGLVETRPGQGTYVVEKIVPFVTTLTGDPSGPGGGNEGTTDRSAGSQHNKRASFSRVQVEIQKASDDVAAGLWIDRQTEVISRHERRYVENDAWSMQTSYYPMEFADRGAEPAQACRQHRAGDRAVPGRHAPYPSGRISRLDCRACAERHRGGLLQAAAGWAGPDVRNIQDCLRRERQAHAADRDRISRPSQPVHR